MDNIDRKIIAELQKDGRLTNQELSERVNLSPSPCLRRVKILENDGIIKGYTVLVDEKAYGLPIIAFVRIRLNSHSAETIQNFEKSIQDEGQILECYIMTGSHDYLLRVLVESLSDYENFIRKRLQPLPGIASIDTSFAYGVVKRSYVYPKV
ncbi:Lrp/AsnC family transcriptional regulator [Escherichia coli]|nr:Lrp/AsnC family transcriptional regulator [Escherichia coli]EFU6042117.1 Lrp/AsnC family transcriptional regulator [Escherichia coli]EGH9464746.1 Lrp/AsnC family transcriptional regulator [Escherichia coli]EGK8619593.1 Lrp/AsnC family transcriptional regulator [Escherichia coli]EGL0807004.1 Lrp/AsnC family transcriptional regulator [Escherichia coli]